MIDDISIKQTATDVVKTIETGLIFENIETDPVSRKILNDTKKMGLIIDIILYKPKNSTPKLPPKINQHTILVPHIPWLE